MKKLFVLCAALLCLSFSAAAQESVAAFDAASPAAEPAAPAPSTQLTPSDREPWQAGLGFQYQHYNVLGQNFHDLGYNTQVTRFINNWFGVEGTVAMGWGSTGPTRIWMRNLYSSAADHTSRGTITVDSNRLYMFWSAGSISDSRRPPRDSAAIPRSVSWAAAEWTTSLDRECIYGFRAITSARILRPRLPTSNLTTRSEPAWFSTSKRLNVEVSLAGIGRSVSAWCRPKYFRGASRYIFRQCLSLDRVFSGTGFSLWIYDFCQAPTGQTICVAVSIELAGFRIQNPQAEACASATQTAFPKN